MSTQMESSQALNLSAWCRKCFGARTITDRMKDELSELEKSIYLNQLTISKAEHNVSYALARKKYLVKQLAIPTLVTQELTKGQV